MEHFRSQCRQVLCHKNFGNLTSVYDASNCADTQANWANEQWLWVFIVIS